MNASTSGRSTPSDITCYTPLLTPMDTSDVPETDQDSSTPDRHASQTRFTNLPSPQSLYQEMKSGMSGHGLGERTPEGDLISLAPFESDDHMPAGSIVAISLPPNFVDEQEDDLAESTRSSTSFHVAPTGKGQLVQIRQGLLSPTLPISVASTPQTLFMDEIFSDMKCYFQSYFKSEAWVPYSEEPVNFDGDERRIVSSQDSMGVIEANNSIFDLKNPGSLVTLYEVACLLLQREDYGEAIKFVDQAYALIKELLREEHPHLFSCLFLVVSILGARGRTELVNPLLEQAYEMSEVIHGGSHPLTRMISCFSRAAEERDALSELGLRAAVMMFDDMIGADHTYSLRMRYVSSWESFQRGQFKEALGQLSGLLETYEKVAGKGHLHARQTLFAMAQVFAEQGDLVAAENALRDVYIRSETLFDKDPPLMINIESLRMLAVVYRRQENYALTEMVLCKALGVGLKLLGREHPTVLLIRHELRSMWQT